MNADLVGEISRGVIAFAVIAGLIFLAATGKPIPDGYTPIATAIVGFYFGQATAAIGARLAAR